MDRAQLPAARGAARGSGRRLVPRGGDSARGSRLPAGGVGFLPLTPTPLPEGEGLGPRRRGTCALIRETPLSPRAPRERGRGEGKDILQPLAEPLPRGTRVADGAALEATLAEIGSSLPRCRHLEVLECETVQAHRSVRIHLSDSGGTRPLLLARLDPPASWRLQGTRRRDARWLRAQPALRAAAGLPSTK